MSDLESFKQLLFSKPIFSTALCGKLYSQETTYQTDDGGRGTEPITHNEEYVVLINSRNPQVEQMCNQAFESAARLLREGKKFRLSVSICFFPSFCIKIFILYQR